MEELLDPDGCTSRDAEVLPEHREAGLTRQQQAEDYAAHISSISREYVPLSRARLPDRVAHALDNALCQGHPSLPEHEVFKVLSERKLTGGVEGDLDPRIVRDCLVELAYPVGCIYRTAVEQHHWPVQWKVEKQVMLKKCPVPQSKDDIRNLGLSTFFNKGLEKVLVDLLWPYVRRFVSWDLLGGKKKCATNH